MHREEVGVTLTANFTKPFRRHVTTLSSICKYGHFFTQDLLKALTDVKLLVAKNTKNKMHNIKDAHEHEFHDQISLCCYANVSVMRKSQMLYQGNWKMKGKKPPIFQKETYQASN